MRWLFARFFVISKAEKTRRNAMKNAVSKLEAGDLRGKKMRQKFHRKCQAKVEDTDLPKKTKRRNTRKKRAMEMASYP
jgi:hypothetical protein